MTRDELIELAPRLARHALSHYEAKQLADFLRQIAESQPEAWRVECRQDTGADWRKWADYAREQGARSEACRFPDDIEARVVPLYRLPLED